MTNKQNSTDEIVNRIDYLQSLVLKKIISQDNLLELKELQKKLAHKKQNFYF